MKNRTNNKYISPSKLFMLSLWLLFVLLFIKSLDIPISFAKDAVFIGIKELARRNILPIILSFFIIYDIFIYKQIIIQMKDCPDLPDSMVKCEKINSGTIDIIISIILPLVFININKWNDILFMIVLIVILGIIYIRTDNVYKNPTLAMLGFNLYEVKLKSDLENTLMVFTKDKLTIKSTISNTLISNGYYYAKEKWNE